MLQHFQITGRRKRKRKRSRRWVLLRLPSRESYWTCVSTPSLTADPCSLLVVTVVTAFCADYCKYPSFFSFWKRSMISCLLLSVVASIEEFAERYSVPKPFIGLILLPIVVSEYRILFSCQVNYPFNLGKCSWACHFCMDGYEKSNGTYDHHLRWKLDCEYFCKQVHLNLNTIHCVNSKSQLLWFLYWWSLDGCKYWIL